MLKYLQILINDYIWFTYLFSFILGIITDIIWCKWSIAVSKQYSIAAANFAVLIYLIGIIYTLLIIELQTIPICLYMLGGWIGTFLTVKLLK